MSLHSSLKVKSGALRRHRNVLTRAERVEFLASKDEFEIGNDSPMGLIKVANRKVATMKKKPAKEEGEEGAVEGGEATVGDDASATLETPPKA